MKDARAWVAKGFLAPILGLMLACGGADSAPEEPAPPPVQPAPRDYHADLKAQLAAYGSSIQAEIASGDSQTYYYTSYYLHGLAAGAEASGDTSVMDTLLGYINQLMSKAKPLVRNGVTYQEFGPWDANGNPWQLQTFQISVPLARTAAVIYGNPALKARYQAQADQILAFVHQSVFLYWFDKSSGVYADPRSSRLGGQIPWLPSELGGWGNYPVWNDKCSHVGAMAAWMYKATRDPLYLEYATRIAQGFRTHVTVQPDGSWIWDQGIVPLDVDNRAGSPDTSHANREPMMVVSMYEAGVVFQLADVRAMAATFTNRIWNHSDSDPMFANYITGSNLPYGSRGAWDNGFIYAGWSMLGRYSAEAQRVLALSYQIIQTRNPLNNASLSDNGTSYGRIELSGTLARNAAAS